jgi:integral membrane protein
MTLLEKFFSKYPEQKIILWFQRICLAEAVSWFLLFTAMYWIRADKESLLPTIYIIIIGNIHGLFFSLYLLLILPVKKIFQWDDEDFVFALISAFFPFATIWVDKKLARFDRE